MSDKIYDRLIDRLNSMGAVPYLKTPELFALLAFFYTPQEAELATGMPSGTFTADAFAREISGDPGEVTSALEEMAGKATVRYSYSGEVKVYSLMPLVPGVIEYQLMKGEIDERAREMARLIRNHRDAIQRETAVNPKTTNLVPYLRVIPVEEEIQGGSRILPYSEVSGYIEQAELISVGHCYCRHMAALMGEDLCDTPIEACFSLGLRSRYHIEQGIHREISKTEAFRILDECEKAGLMHVATNTENIHNICNCCGCHCRAVASGDHIADSSYIVSFDEEACSGCEECVDRCQVSAITMEGDSAVIAFERCLGCGLCVSTCPTEALAMIPREKTPYIYADVEERQAASRELLQSGQQIFG